MFMTFLLGIAVLGLCTGALLSLGGSVWALSGDAVADAYGSGRSLRALGWLVALLGLLLFVVALLAIVPMVVLA